MTSHILKEIKLWGNEKYAIVQQYYNDGSIGIVGGWYHWPVVGAPYFVGAAEPELPKYVIAKIRKYEKLS